MNKLIDITGIVLETPRLILREFQESDVEDLYEYAKVEGVGEMAGWLHHENINVSKRILELFIQSKTTFAIVYKENNKVIGSLGIDKYEEDVFPEFQEKQGREIGYVLSKEYWGQGLMPEAVHKVIEYLFEKEQLDFLICGHFVHNLQSYRVQEKCGFVHYKKRIRESAIGTRESWYSLLERDNYVRNY